METALSKEKSIRRRLYRVLRKTGVNKEIIKPSASFLDDLNFDKIDWTIFAYYLECVFNISIKDDELDKFGNVSDTLQFLKTELIYVRN